MNGQSKISYSFGDYLLEVSERRLWKEKTVIPLTHKAFETLVILVSSKGRVVEKDFLLDKVWADTFVGEGTVAQNILTLRKTLGILADGRQLIETVPRVGYRFVADVKEIVSDDEIVILEHRVKTEFTAEHKTYSDEQAIAVRKTQSTKSFFANPTLAAALIASSILIIVGIIFAVRYFWQAENFASSKFNKIEIKKLTSEGSIFRSSAISPDGKYLALIEVRGEDQLISVKQTDNSSSIEILPPKKQTILGLTFSPDGKQIYYTSYKKDDSSSLLEGSLFRIPMLGGTPQEILVDIDSPAAISPDGSQIAFVRNSPKAKESALMIASIDGTGARKISTRSYNEAFSSFGLAWSPDKKTIACASYLTGAIGKQMDVILVNAATGEQKPLTKDNWLWIGQIDWLKDGSGIVFPAWNARSSVLADEIWLVSTEGVARQISSGINGVFSLNLTADSNSITAIKSNLLADFWVASAPDFKQVTKISQSHAEFNLSAPGISWLPDNRIIFGSTFNGNLDIWTMSADGKNRQQLTTGGTADYFPISSNDGQTIVFISNRTGRENLWRMKPDGNKQEQLTDEINVSAPNIAPDNRTVYYTSLDEKTGQYILRKIDLESKESTQITSHTTIHPQISPDGKYIVCLFPEATASGFNEETLKLTILLTENGKVFKQFELPSGANRRLYLEWKGNQSFSYLTNENSGTKLWEQPINGDKARLLLDLPDASITRFAWSADGQRLVYEKGVLVDDVILINSMK